jgi:hypothetical protein
VLGDGFIADIVLLEFEGYGDTISQGEGRIVMGEEVTISEEADVSDAEELCPALAADFCVFTGRRDTTFPGSRH